MSASAGSTANFMIAAATRAAGDAKRERDSATEGQITSRRQQQEHDCDEDERVDAVRPGGGDPKQLDCADCEERACRVDDSRQPIGYAESEAALAGRRLVGSIDEQRQRFEHVR